MMSDLMMSDFSYAVLHYCFEPFNTGHAAKIHPERWTKEIRHRHI